MPRVEGHKKKREILSDDAKRKLVVEIEENIARGMNITAACRAAKWDDRQYRLFKKQLAAEGAS